MVFILSGRSFVINLRETFSPVPGFEAGDPSSNTGQGDNFSLELTTDDPPDC